jgi:CRISPR system Cascade subunit CasC
MSEYLQIHGLFDYPASNPNRDRDNEPKRISIGNVDRQRISSQCLKRTIRTSEIFREAFGAPGEANLGMRTKELGSQVYERLRKGGLDEARAEQWTLLLASVFGATKPEKKDTRDHLKNETMFFVSPEEKNALYAYVDRIVTQTMTPPNVKGKEALEKEAAKLRAEILTETPTAVDIAFFGRMFANDKDYSVEAAVQFAHGFSVNPYEAEPDFGTTVDDKKESGVNQGEEDRGSGHLYNFTMGAGIFYCYSSVNVTMLQEKLKDPELVRKACRVFVEAFMTVYPKAKGNSCAQQSRALYGRVERGSKMPRNLALAFSEAIMSKNVPETAVLRLEDLDSKLSKVYGKSYDDMKDFNVLTGEGTLQELLELAGR